MDLCLARPCRESDAMNDDRKSPGANSPGGERIAKVIARAGLCSRRQAEAWIAQGRVSLDGSVVTSPALNIGPGMAVEVDGKPLPKAERIRLWRYHKPSGEVTSWRDPQGRTTVFDSLPKDLPRLHSVGRLDLTTEGLLLLTNDGGLKRHLELPATGWLRRYRARVHGTVDEPALENLGKGCEIDGIRYGAIEARLERRQGSNAWLAIALREGKNREIRRVLEHLGLKVTRLIRISYGPFQLGKLARGALDEVPGKTLAEQLGGGFGGQALRKTGQATARRKPKQAHKAGSGNKAGAGRKPPAKPSPAAAQKSRPPRRAPPKGKGGG